MARLIGPSTTGSSLAAFLDAYQRSREMARQDEALALQTAGVHRQNSLADLQMNEIIRKRQDEEADRGALAAMATVVPPVVAPVVAPPQPAFPLTGAEGLGMPEGPALPPQPAAVTGMTPQALAQQIGADKAARVLGSQQGRAAFGAMGGVTEEQLNERKRLYDFRAQAKQFSRRSDEAKAAGNPLADLDAQEAGLRAVIDVIGPEHYATVNGRMTEITKMRKEIADVAEAEQAAALDGPRIAEGRRLMIEGATTGDPEKFGRGYAMASSVKTKYGRHEVAKFYAPDGLVTKLMEKGQLFQSPAGLIEKRVAAALSPRLGTPEGITSADRVKALRADYFQNPEEWGRVLFDLTKSGREIPRDYQLAATGVFLSRDETLMAAHVAETAEPGNPKAFITAIKAIHQAKKPADPHGELIKVYIAEKTAVHDTRMAVQNARQAIQTELREGREPDPGMHRDLRTAKSRYEAAVRSAKTHRAHLRQRGVDLPEEVEIDESVAEKRAATEAAEKLKAQALRRNPKLTPEELAPIISQGLRQLGF